MAHNLANKDSEIVIFSYAGKSMIGELYNPEKITVGDNTVLGVMGVTASTHYIVNNPCIIEFTIISPNTGSSTINWKLTPLYYRDLIGDTTVTSARFSFRKEEVALSDIANTTIDTNLLSAYKELCK